jgi:hypothetical protein
MSMSAAACVTSCTATYLRRQPEHTVHYHTVQLLLSTWLELAFLEAGCQNATLGVSAEFWWKIASLAIAPLAPRSLPRATPPVRAVQRKSRSCDFL